MLDKRAYQRAYRFKHHDELLAKQREYARAWYQRPEVKAKRREYRQRPEVKAKQREYQQRPEYKAKQREYRQRPEVKAKQREYHQRPEYKARMVELAALKKRIIKLRESKATYEEREEEFPAMLQNRLDCYERLYELHFIEKKEGLPKCVVKTGMKQ